MQTTPTLETYLNLATKMSHSNIFFSLALETAVVAVTPTAATPTEAATEVVATVAVVAVVMVAATVDEEAVVLVPEIACRTSALA